MTFDIDAAITQRFVRSHSDGEGCDPVISAMKGLGEEAEAVENYRERAAHLDGRDKEMNLDLAREEAVHLGEHAQRLSELDPDLSQAVQEGMEEARTSAPDSVERVKKSASFAKTDDEAGDYDLNSYNQDERDSSASDDMTTGHADEVDDAGAAVSWGPGGRELVTDGTALPRQPSAAQKELAAMPDHLKKQMGARASRDDAVRAVRKAFERLGESLGPEFMDRVRSGALSPADLARIFTAKYSELDAQQKKDKEHAEKWAEQMAAASGVIRPPIIPGAMTGPDWDKMGQMNEDMKDWEARVRSADARGDEVKAAKVRSERPPDPMSRPSRVASAIEERAELLANPPKDPEDFAVNALTNDLRTVTGEGLPKKIARALVLANPEIRAFMSRLNDTGVMDFLNMSKEYNLAVKRGEKGLAKERAIWQPLADRILQTYTWMRGQKGLMDAAQQKREEGLAKMREEAAANAEPPDNSDLAVGRHASEQMVDGSLFRVDGKAPFEGVSQKELSDIKKLGMRIRKEMYEQLKKDSEKIRKFYNNDLKSLQKYSDDEYDLYNRRFREEQKKEYPKGLDGKGKYMKLKKSVAQDGKSDIDARIRQWQTSMNCRL